MLFTIYGLVVAMAYPMIVFGFVVWISYAAPQNRLSSTMCWFWCSCTRSASASSASTCQAWRSRGGDHPLQRDRVRRRRPRLRPPGGLPARPGDSPHQPTYPDGVVRGSGRIVEAWVADGTRDRSLERQRRGQRILIPLLPADSTVSDEVRAELLAEVVCQTLTAGTEPTSEYAQRLAAATVAYLDESLDSAEAKYQALWWAWVRWRAARLTGVLRAAVGAPVPGRVRGVGATASRGSGVDRLAAGRSAFGGGSGRVAGAEETCAGCGVGAVEAAPSGQGTGLRRRSWCRAV
ncbi:hypothetical protein A8926_5205 [Saccharopolyspora spinosa]|uniref:Uncharacterized protein n=1 Tax=Saccharopolyspora spinosa TaxID=60894 RepID=A0A2N3Y2W4_SACSN|nr:hypothetical protein A8926_5205 [Saccharopolyspora spinosa]